MLELPVQRPTSDIQVWPVQLDFWREKLSKDAYEETHQLKCSMRYVLELVQRLAQDLLTMSWASKTNDQHLFPKKVEKANKQIQAEHFCWASTGKQGSRF